MSAQDTNCRNIFQLRKMVSFESMTLPGRRGDLMSVFLGAAILNCSQDVFYSKYKSDSSIFKPPAS